jgi:hypothetical protein
MFGKCVETAWSLRRDMRACVRGMAASAKAVMGSDGQAMGGRSSRPSPALKWKNQAGSAPFSSSALTGFTCALRVAAEIISSGNFGVRSAFSRPLASWKVSANWV